MPELPEVEVVRRTLQPEIEGKTIRAVEVYWPRIVRHPAVDTFCQTLSGQTIGALSRTGKYLRIEIGREWEWIVHFRMTGKFRLLPSTERHQKHVHVYVHFEEDTDGLAYVDVRKFGDLFLVHKGDYQCIKGLYKAGLDPLSDDFSFERFCSLITPRKRMIKALLLDQSVITGLGNYICDEMLWFDDAPGIHPQRNAATLTEDELARMYRRLQDTIDGSIRLGGNTFRDFSYGDGLQGDFKQMLRVYGRKGEACYRCQTPIIRQVIAGRSTHFCPKCQQL